jgi:hypothetical protein
MDPQCRKMSTIDEDEEKLTKESMSTRKIKRVATGQII